MSFTTSALALQLERAARRLGDRLAELEEVLQRGDTDAWPAFCDTAQALAAVLPSIAPERRGALLTTAQMAERLNVKPKTLLRRKARGEISPALVLGKRGSGALRWRGDEVAR